MIKKIVAALAVCGLAFAPAACMDSTPPARAVTSTGNYVVWAVGDMCEHRTSPACGPVASLIAKDTTKDAFLALGDLQYEDGTLTEYNTYYKPAVDLKIGSITKPSPGNHEYHTSGASGFYSFFGNRAPAKYYAFTLGKWRIISANSNCSSVGGCDAGSPQGTFISNQLAGTEPCEIVFAHHEFMSDSTHGDTAEGKSLFTLAYNGKAELYLAGHDHNYQRFTARKPDKTVSSTGTVPMVVGTGGADRYGFNSTNRSAYRTSSAFGALKLTLSSTGYTGKFINTSGVTMDTFSGTCH